MAVAKPRKIPRRKSASIWGLVMLFLVFTSTFLFLRSPFFTVKQFIICGNKRVSSEEIIARCAQRSQNIFAFDLDKARRSIEASPWIEKASCSRKLPDKIVIHVVERTPVAFAPVGDKLWLVDSSGRVLGEDDGTLERLVALTGVTENLVPGQYLDDSKYGWGLKILSMLGPVAKSKVTEVFMKNGECTLILDDGCKVFLGKEKIGNTTVVIVLDSILKQLNEAGEVAEYIDLRFEKQAVKLRSGD